MDLKEIKIYLAIRYLYATVRQLHIKYMEM